MRHNPPRIIIPYQPHIYRLIVFVSCIILYSNHSDAQIDCELNDVTATITLVDGAEIISGSSTIFAAAPRGEETFGNPLEIRARNCGEITLEITLSYFWVQGLFDIAWIHGVSFDASDGWSSAAAGELGEGWDYYDEITGDCSNNTYRDGYFYDPCNPLFNYESSCSCREFFIIAVECDECESPEDNWGIDCSGNGCQDFTFRLTYCPSVTGDLEEEVSFFLTNDGESGSWEAAIGCFYKVTYPVIIKSAGVAVNEDAYGPDCPGTCYTLDAGEGCDGYIWSTGETSQSIEVCPDSNSDYQVTVTSCGPDLVGVFPVIVEECFDANAGELTINHSECPQEGVEVLLNDGNSLDPFDNITFYTNSDDIILEILTESDFGAFECGDYLFYNFNYDTEENGIQLPEVGMSILDIQDQGTCCDLSEPFLVEFIDNEIPMFLDPPQDVTISCFHENIEIPMLEWIDNCTTGGSTLGIIDDNTDFCSGGQTSITWIIIDECGNTNSHTQNLTYTVPPRPQLTGTLPVDIIISCADEFPMNAIITYSNSASDLNCLFEGEIISMDFIPEDCNTEDVIRTWSYSDVCGNQLFYSQRISYAEVSDVEFLGSLPEDITVNCMEILPDMEPLLYSNNADQENCLIEGEIEGIQIGTQDDCNAESVSRIWEISIPCGNTISHTQLITLVKDSVPPTIVSDADLYIPNIISINENPPNNKFIIFANEEVEQIDELSIYSRWGELVFSQNNFQPNDEQSGWDGSMDGKMPQAGVYIFYIEVKLQDGNTVIETGNITIMD